MKLKKIKIFLIVLLIAFLISYLIPNKTVYEAISQTIVTEVEVEEVIELTGELKRICSCESTGNPNSEPTHYDKDGNVLRGVVNNQDVGICQINLKYHNYTAQTLGLDLFKEEDNIKYAKGLYAAQGSTPWNWSKHCWQK